MHPQSAEPPRKPPSLPNFRTGCRKNVAAVLVCLFFASCVFGQSDGQGQPHRFLHIGEKQGLGGTKPTCVFQDHFGFIWVGTWDGLYRFDGFSCKLFEHQPGDSTSLPSNFIACHAFHEDKNGDLWVATFDAGFVKFDRKTERFRCFRAAADGPGSDAINALSGDGEGGIWVGTRGKGLSHYSPETNRFSNYILTEPVADTLMGSSQLLDVCPSRSGKLWMGTSAGLASLDANGHFRRYFPDPRRRNSLSAAYSLDVFEDHQNRIWACSGNGLNRFVAPDSFIRYFPAGKPGVPDDLRYNYIQRVFQDSDGDFWLGTLAGLVRFRPEAPGQLPENSQFEAIRHDPLDPSTISKGGIHGIFEDRHGHIWFATDGGLCFLDKKAAPLGDKNWAVVRAILPSTSVLYGGGFTSRRQAGSVPFYFTELKLFNQPVRPGGPDGLLRQPIYMTDKIRLDYEQNVISIAFAALNFTAPEKQVFRYRLTPFHENWQQNGEKREVTFTNLPPGEYLLRVETSENGYEWSGKTLVLRIRPPWYRAGLTYLFYALAIGGFLFTARWFELRRHRAQAETYRLRELDGFKTRFYTNITHEFRTPLTVILGMAEQIRKQPGVVSRWVLAARIIFRGRFGRHSEWLRRK